jgi:hypothetical protein
VECILSPVALILGRYSSISKTADSAASALLVFPDAVLQHAARSDEFQRKVADEMT